MDCLEHVLKVPVLLFCPSVIILAAVLTWKPTGLLLGERKHRLYQCVSQPPGLTALVAW